MLHSCAIRPIHYELSAKHVLFYPSPFKPKRPGMGVGGGAVNDDSSRILRDGLGGVVAMLFIYVKRTPRVHNCREARSRISDDNIGYRKTMNMVVSLYCHNCCHETPPLN